jgi:hypothetical protein
MLTGFDDTNIKKLLITLSEILIAPALLKKYISLRGL